jgi:hypothetical protein
MTKYSNAQLDTLAAAVPGPYGPLTRVSDVAVEANFDDNGDVKLKFTSPVLTTPVYISRNQLADAQMRDKVIFEAQAGKGHNSVVEKIFEVVRTTYAYLKNAAGPEYTDTEKEVAYNLLRSITPLIGAMPKISNAWSEGDIPTIANTISGSGLNRTSTVVITGGTPFAVVIDWGDGTFSVGTGSAAYGPHTYVAGTYTIRATVVGPKGVAEDRDTVTPA